MTNYAVIYNQPLHKDPVIKQPGFNGKSPSVFLSGSSGYLCGCCFPCLLGGFWGF